MIHANRLANREYVAALTNAFFHFLLENIKLEADVAEKCGYSDYVYFSRRFKQVTGISPKEWRDSV